jgi:hypothetical protein
MNHTTDRQPQKLPNESKAWTLRDRLWKNLGILWKTLLSLWKYWGIHGGKLDQKIRIAN